MNTDQRLLRAPNTEQVIAEWGEPAIPDMPMPDPKREVVALGTAVFQDVAPRIYDSHRMLVANMAAKQGVNFWMLPCQERMPFPDAPLFALAAMFRLEQRVGRNCDWFLWVEDDVAVPQDLFDILRASADPEKRPFVCAPGFIRNYPFNPAVWEMRNGVYTRWEDVPASGVYPVAASGLVAALFHRSLFNRVPQPWFAITSNKLFVNAQGKAEVDKGMRPDSWWAEQLRSVGIPVYVNCDAKVTHFGMPIPINRETAATLRALPFFQDIQDFERTLRGLPARRGGGLSPSVRPGVPERVDGAVTSNGGIGPTAAQGESAILHGAGTAPAPCAELPVQRRIVDETAIWRGSGDSPWWQTG